jgi:non-specific serine/threonine protein kinase
VRFQSAASLMRLRQLSNHPKMIDKKSELDSGKYIAVTRYLKPCAIQSKNDCVQFVCV